MLRNGAVLLIAFMGANGLLAQLPAYDPGWFQKMNPNYAERSGMFYETKYLPTAAANLSKAVGSPALTEATAKQLLRDHIYHCLNVYVEGNGTVTRAERQALNDEFDRTIKELLKNDKAYAKYLAWRANPSREENPLAFLFSHPFALPAVLSDELKQAGWAVENITDAKQLGQYQARASFAPDQVLIFKNTKIK
jgi:hypothetical protein